MLKSISQSRGVCTVAVVCGGGRNPELAADKCVRGRRGACRGSNCRPASAFLLWFMEESQAADKCMCMVAVVHGGGSHAQAAAPDA